MSTYTAYRSRAYSPASERASFILKTYAHLLLAIVGFVLLEFWLFRSGHAYRILEVMPLAGKGWLVVLGAFAGVSAVAHSLAQNAHAKPLQYAGLMLYTAAEAVIFVPMIWIAQVRCPHVIQPAAVITMIGFTALTVVVVFTRAKFTFLRGILCWAGAIAMMLIVVNCLYGLTLGPAFSIGMIAFAGASILYDTSMVLEEYDTDQSVAAALSLFSSVMLLFWYVLRLFIEREE